MKARPTRPAAKILKGDPYGNTPDEILENIEDAQRVTAGTICNAKVTKPV